MSSDGRTLPPPGKRPAPPRRAPEPPPLPVAEPRQRQETSPGLGPAERHDDSEGERALRESQAREAQLLAELKAISKKPANVSFPPPVVEDRRRERPSSEPPSVKEIKSPWERLGYKVATAVVAGLVLVIGGLALWAYTAIGARTEAIKAAQKAQLEAEGRDAQMRRYLGVLTWILDCRNDQQLEVNASLLPAQDRMGSAGKQAAWVIKCPTKLPPPP